LLREGRFGRLKVIHVGANRNSKARRLCDFLLVRNITLVLSFTVSEISQLLCSPDLTPIPP